jgi:hypothetical protein
MRQGSAEDERALDAMIGMPRGRVPQGADGERYGRPGAEPNLRSSTN